LPDHVEAWASREAPPGISRTEFREFSYSLYEAMSREGFGPKDLDVRLQGSSARFFSGEHKSLPTTAEIATDNQALDRMRTWFGDDPNHPLRRPFDSMHLLGLEDEPSDYDIQLSSDSMANACRERWEANGPQGDLTHPKYGSSTSAYLRIYFRRCGSGLVNGPSECSWRFWKGGNSWQRRDALKDASRESWILFYASQIRRGIMSDGYNPNGRSIN